MNDPEPTKIPAPVDSGVNGVAIHLSYIRRDIDEIKSNQVKNNNELKAAIDGLHNSYVTRFDFAEHLKSDEDHEIRIRRLQTYQDNLSGKIWGIGILAGLIPGAVSILVSHFWK